MMSSIQSRILGQVVMITLETVVIMDKEQRLADHTCNSNLHSSFTSISVPSHTNNPHDFISDILYHKHFIMEKYLYHKNIVIITHQ